MVFTALCCCNDPVLWGFILHQSQQHGNSLPSRVVKGEWVVLISSEPPQAFSKQTFSHQGIREFFVSTVRLKLWCLSCTAELLPPPRMQIAKTCCSRISYLRMLAAQCRNTIPSESDTALGNDTARHHTQRIILFAALGFGVPLGAFREPALGIVVCSWTLIIQMFQ